jgi:Tfp pilus assembly PilM family ATPase
MPRYAWGIDIGDGTLKAVRVKSERRGYCVVKVIEIPYLDPFLKKKTPPAPLDRRALAALYQLGSTEKAHDLDWIAVGYPSFHAVEGSVEIPRVDEKLREEMISYEVGKRYGGDLEKAILHHKALRLKSTDMEQVTALAVNRKEFNAFLHYLGEAGIPFDRIITSNAALVDMARICVPANDDYVILSPGYSATNMVLMRKGDFWTRTLPVGLPCAPGKTIEIPQDKILRFCGILKTEMKTFIDATFIGEGFEPSRVMISGEGARAPSFINNLDTALPAPVEVLRPSGRLRIRLSKDSAGMAHEDVYTMGKAIGLAVGMLDGSQRSCQLAGASPGRKTLRKLPLLAKLCAILLLLCIGLAGHVGFRGERLAGIGELLEPLSPEYKIETLTDLRERIDRLKEEIEILHKAFEDRVKWRQLGWQFSRFEQKSTRDTFGDYHMTNLEMEFGEMTGMEVTVATRLGGEEKVLRELKSMFPPTYEPPQLEGPLPAMEETPPEGMAPLVLFKMRGELR